MKFPRQWSFISHTFLYGILALTDEFLLEILCTLLVSQNIFMYNSLKYVQIHHMLQRFDFAIKSIAIRGISSTSLKYFPWIPKYISFFIYILDFPFSIWLLKPLKLFKCISIKTPARRELVTAQQLMWHNSTAWTEVRDICPLYWLKHIWLHIRNRWTNCHDIISGGLYILCFSHYGEVVCLSVSVLEVAAPLAGMADDT